MARSGQASAGSPLRLSGEGEIRLSRYWQPCMTPGPDRSLQASADDIEAALHESVAAHTAADVPVGAYLSSGVDSSVLAAAAARLAPLRTFSIGFEIGGWRAQRAAGCPRHGHATRHQPS